MRNNKLGKRALITGITGQDGSYLAELLLQKGYEVYGTCENPALIQSSNIEPFRNRIGLHCIHITDLPQVNKLVKDVKPDEVYHLEEMSMVGLSFREPEKTYKFNFNGTENLLKAVLRHSPHARVYQASTSEMFGNAADPPQDESTSFDPVSPYGKSKKDSHVKLVDDFARKKNGMFAVGGILFNHESPRKSIDFVTRKISHSVARIKMGLDNRIALGNLEARRDWGFAGDYVKAMWLMLQNDEPEDFVVATGNSYSVTEFLDYAFHYVDLDYEIIDLSDELAERADEIMQKSLGRGGPYVVIHPRFFRPVDIKELVGNSSRIRKKLGWKPEKSFSDLVEMMVKSDLEALGSE